MSSGHISVGIAASSTGGTLVGPLDLHESSRTDPGGPTTLYISLYKTQIYSIITITIKNITIHIIINYI